MKLYRFIPFLFATSVFADGHSVVQLGQETAPTQWQGDAVHFAIAGTIGGDVVNLYDLPPAAVQLDGRRTYVGGADWMPYTAFDLTISVEGVPLITVVVESEDFSAHFLPTDLPIAAQVSAEDIAVTVTFGAGSSSETSLTGWSGNFSFELDDQADYPAEDGNVGGFLTAQNGADSFALSFTVPMVGAIIVE